MMTLNIPLAFWGGSPGAGELVVVFAVVLLLFGAKKLPSIARTMGRTLEEFRRAARDFSNDVMRADRCDHSDMHMDCAEDRSLDEPDTDKNEGVDKHA